MCKGSIIFLYFFMLFISNVCASEKIINETDIIDKEFFYKVAKKLNVKYKYDNKQFFIPAMCYNDFVRKLVTAKALNENYLLTTIPKLLFYKEKIKFFKELRIQLKLLESNDIYKALVFLQSHGLKRDIYICVNGGELTINSKEDIRFFCNLILNNPKIFFIDCRNYEVAKTSFKKRKYMASVPVGLPFARKNSLKEAINVLEKLEIPYTINSEKINLSAKQLNKSKIFWQIYVNEANYDKVYYKFMAFGIHGFKEEKYILDSFQNLKYNSLIQYSNEMNIEYDLLIDILKFNFIFEGDVAIDYLSENKINVYLNYLESGALQTENRKQMIQRKIINFFKDYNLEVKKIYLTSESN